MKDRPKFLPIDYHLLHEKISQVKDQLAATSRLIGDTTRESSETYHDNAPYDSLRHDEAFLKQHLDRYQRWYADAVIISMPVEMDLIQLGHQVIALFLHNRQEQVFEITSFHCLRGFAGRVLPVSYNSPLGAQLLGKKVGDIVDVPDRDITLKVLEISLPS